MKQDRWLCEVWGQAGTHEFGLICHIHEATCFCVLSLSLLLVPFTMSFSMNDYKHILDNAREKWMRDKDLPPISVPSLPRAVLLAQVMNVMDSMSSQVMVR